MDKRELSERDFCTNLIAPSILHAGWEQGQFREEANLTKGRVLVRGKLATRVQNPEAKVGAKHAAFVLYETPNVALATFEAKRNHYPMGHGMGHALLYAEMLDAPFAISSKLDGFLLHNRTGITSPTIRELTLEEFAANVAKAFALSTTNVFMQET